jgi:flagellar assembly protein FliH
MTVIDRSDLSECFRWELPPIEQAQPPEPELAVTESPPVGSAPGEPDAAVTPGPGLSIEEIETLRETATREGFQVGYRDGQQQAESDVAERLARLGALIAALTSPLEALDHEVENELVSLVTDIARQLVRRELSTQPEQIVAVLREALSLLPIHQRQIRVYLHPDDAHLVEELLHLEERPWRIDEDPLLSRGGCRVVSDTSQIDATVEYRVGAIVARVLGDQRREANHA